jgi:AbrB family looped-hinge helix DNA binding protein
MATQVKVSSKYQIAVPKAARQKLHIQRGDWLLAEVRDDVLILIPRPKDFVTHLAGLHKEIWEGIDAGKYVAGERQAWTDSLEP